MSAAKDVKDATSEVKEVESPCNDGIRSPFKAEPFKSDDCNFDIALRKINNKQ